MMRRLLHLRRSMVNSLIIGCDVMKQAAPAPFKLLIDSA
jgi:hypothetical protein